MNTPKLQQTPLGGSADRLVVAVWFERGWERAIEARSRDWDSLPQSARERIANRWALSSANEIVSRGDYDSFYTSHNV